MDTIAIATPDRQAELEALRRLLLADERRSIETLRRALGVLDERVGDDDRFRDTMTRGLVAAFRAAEAAQHQELAEALSPLVLAGIRREIVQSRDLMVEALYPITGRLVSTAVARAFQRLVADINGRLEAAVSPLNWRRRVKSLLTGRPLAEIILSETAGFRLERILLIDRTTGALLAAWIADEQEAPADDGQAALMSGLLSAIVSFSRDAFQGDGHDLRALDLGERVVMLRSSARRIVAAVGHGTVNAELEARADSAFLSLLELSTETDSELASQALLASLASAIAEPPAPARRKGPPVPLLVATALLLAALGYWGLRSYEAHRAEQRLDTALATVGDKVGAAGGALVLTRDGATKTVKAVGLLPSEAARHDLEAAIARDLPGYRLAAQIITATGGPASLDKAMGLDAQGQRLGDAIASLRGDTARQFEDVGKRLETAEARTATEADKLRASIDAATSSLRDPQTALYLTLPSYAVFFQEGSAYRSPADAERDLDTIAALLKGKPGPKVRLVGYGDDIGTRPANLKIALARAQKVAADLLQRGIDPSRLILAARDGSQEITQGHGPGSSNRRVTFEPALIGE